MQQDSSSAGVPTAAASSAGADRSRRSGLSKLFYDLRHRRRRFRQLAGVVLVFVLTFAGHPTTALLAAGAAAVCLGMVIRLWASGFVMKNEVLATIGPYAHVRHPLYVGNLTIALGFCLASGLWWSYPLTLIVLFIFYPDAVRYEDSKLDRLFPGQWRKWAKERSALVPSIRPYESGDDQEKQRAEWSLKLSMMRNGEPIHIAAGLACLGYLYLQLP